MTRRVIHLMAFALAALFTTTGAAAQEAKAKATMSPAGAWNFVIDSPHGKLTWNLEIKMDAAGKVTGTIAGDQFGKLEVAGKFAEGRLTFTVINSDADLSFAGKMKDADTLLGTLTGHGDMACTATRV